ncbi:MAG: hypothetical protein PHG48_08210 [Eubacteriales bacterium]|nr:hypothetical protein [Eubacteriales bacterium]
MCGRGLAAKTQFGDFAGISTILKHNALCIELTAAIRAEALRCSLSEAIQSRTVFGPFSALSIDG